MNMTLQELIDRFRPWLDDESVGLRRSWEEMFKYTLKHFPGGTLLQAFDLDLLSDRLLSSGMHRPIVEGYVKRWRDLIARADSL
jgi:hypothetical protein